MLHPVHRRSLRLTRPVATTNGFDAEPIAGPRTLDDVYAGIDARLADL